MVLFFIYSFNSPYLKLYNISSKLNLELNAFDSYNFDDSLFLEFIILHSYLGEFKVLYYP